MRDNDERAWRHGNYVQAAIIASFPKGRKYPTKPLLEDQFIADEDGEIHEITDAERFWAWAESMNQSMEIKAIDKKIAEERAENKSDM